MARPHYPGVRDPKIEFEALRDAYAKVIKMSVGCRPFGTDYLILHALTTAFNTAAFHFTKDPTFFARKP